MKILQKYALLKRGLLLPKKIVKFVNSFDFVKKYKRDRNKDRKW